MSAQVNENTATVAWFVGSAFGRSEDQTARFLAEGVWEVRNPTDKERALVKSMSVGDRIAIKATYVRKHGLPFDKQFRIGHSYVTPAYRLEVGETQRWFKQVVETEIGPLLDEYWFDASDEAQKARRRLLQDW